MPSIEVVYTILQNKEDVIKTKKFNGRIALDLAIKYTKEVIKKGVDKNDITIFKVNGDETIGMWEKSANGKWLFMEMDG